MTLFNRLRPGLFTKLMLAFLSVIVVGGVLAISLTRRALAGEFTIYTTATQERQAEALAPFLGSYYAEQGSWRDVDSLLATTDNNAMGDMMDNDADGMMMGGRRQSQGGMSGWPGMWTMMSNRVLVVDGNGRIVADTTAELTDQQMQAETLQENGAPIIANGQQVGTVLVTTGIQSAEQNTRFLQHVNRSIFFSVLAASGVALLFGGLIIWRVSRPLRQLTLAAQNMAANNFEQRVSIPPGDEIGDLATAFNRMAEKLSHAEISRQQMTADIAHELRTPITVIQGNVEALQDGVFPLTLEALDPIMDKIRLLARLVEDLRQLSLAEAEQLALDYRPINLGTLLRQTAESLKPTAADKSISIIQNLEIEAIVNIDEQRIKQVLLNLLSNALHHTPEGGSITLSLAKEDDNVLVSVRDTGSGIPAESLPYVFERFYRVDQGRTRAADGSGSGLGLAVAQAIVQAHGGRMGVSSSIGQGTTFWFTLAG